MKTCYQKKKKKAEKFTKQKYINNTKPPLIILRLSDFFSFLWIRDIWCHGFSRKVHMLNHWHRLHRRVSSVIRCYCRGAWIRRASHHGSPLYIRCMWISSFIKARGEIIQFLSLTVFILYQSFVLVSYSSLLPRNFPFLFYFYFYIL